MADYFDNKAVEALVAEYVADGCINIELRNRIMQEAVPLIKAIIATFKLDRLSVVKDPTWEQELINVAWMQIEKTLYKFDNSPGHTKLFSMWTSVAKNVMLAHIKHDSRNYRGFDRLVDNSLAERQSYTPSYIDRFLEEARKVFEYDDEALLILKHLEILAQTDEKLTQALMAKLSKATGLPRKRIQRFLLDVRMRAFEFSDSPLNKEHMEIGRPTGEGAPWDDSSQDD